MSVHNRTIQLFVSALALVACLCALSASAFVPTEVAEAATGNWDLNGNAGIDPATNFLGTTDNVPLSLRVNNVVGWRLKPAGSNTPNVLGGFGGNLAHTGAYGATIGGGGAEDKDNNALKNSVCGHFATVAGGEANTAGDCTVREAIDSWATIGGGDGNLATALFATIGGGSTNRAAGENSTVAGGNDNQAQDKNATVGGGNANTAAAEDTTVGGGTGNVAGDQKATVAGGAGNTAGEESATIGGGESNSIRAAASTIAGGYQNTIVDFYGAIGGGESNTVNGTHGTVAGGWLNSAGGDSSVVGGGWKNSADGNYSTVAGGAQNEANGAYSVALGNRAKANANGAFVFADSNAFNFKNNTANAFRVRSTGGVRFVLGINGSGGTTWSCAASNGNSWACSSDRNAKENFETVDGRALLEQLNGIPILKWNAKGQDPHVKHLGPMAQDFYTAFGLGDDDKLISTIDLDGVALAGIQTLYQQARTQEETIAAQQARIGALEARLDAMGGSSAFTQAAPRMDWLALNSVLSVGAVVIAVGGVLYGRRK